MIEIFCPRDANLTHAQILSFWVGLLRKAGFRQEGLRVGAVCKNGELRDICEFGLM